MHQALDPWLPTRDLCSWGSHGGRVSWSSACAPRQARMLVGRPWQGPSIQNSSLHQSLLCSEFQGGDFLPSLLKSNPLVEMVHVPRLASKLAGVPPGTQVPQLLDEDALAAACGQVREVSM